MPGLRRTNHPAPLIGRSGRLAYQAPSGLQPAVQAGRRSRGRIVEAATNRTTPKFTGLPPPGEYASRGSGSLTARGRHRDALGRPDGAVPLEGDCCGPRAVGGRRAAKRRGRNARGRVAQEAHHLLAALALCRTVRLQHARGGALHRPSAVATCPPVPMPRAHTRVLADARHAASLAFAGSPKRAHLLWRRAGPRKKNTPAGSADGYRWTRPS